MILKGARAVVTGASSGIGDATATLLAARGADVWPLNPNGDLAANIMIETREAVKNIDEIASVPGVGGTPCQGTGSNRSSAPSSSSVSA